MRASDGSDRVCRIVAMCRTYAPPGRGNRASAKVRPAALERENVRLRIGQDDAAANDFLLAAKRKRRQTTQQLKVCPINREFVLRKILTFMFIDTY